METERLKLKDEGWTGTPPQTMKEVARRWAEQPDAEKQKWAADAQQRKEATIRSLAEGEADEEQQVVVEAAAPEIIEVDDSEEPPPKKKKKKKKPEAEAATA